jgi:SRSO17 transposase
MSLLEHPTAQALLADAEVSASDVRSCVGRLQRFLRRYLPRFYREEQRELARVVIEGKLSKLERKTSEPIAYLAERERKPIQNFVGAGGWNDEAVMEELRSHVAEVMAEPDGVLVIDPSGFAKKGTASCGVSRQWCGRLGKVDNCQVGVFLTYVGKKSYAPLDRQLYLPKDWAEDEQRRQMTHVPEYVEFQESWRIGLSLLDRSRPRLLFGWVAGDDELGRATQFREQLRERQRRYVLDVPCNTLIRNLEEQPAPGHRLPPWRRADEWAKVQPLERWQRFVRGDGSKGPKHVEALEARVQTKGEDGRIGAQERLVVIRTIAKEPQVWYTVSNAAATVSREAIVKAQGRRHGMEELLQAGKGEVGLSHYEVRSWVGWHHHMTLSLLALWFLVLERLDLVKKKSLP